MGAVTLMELEADRLAAIYASRIAALPQRATFTPADLLTPDFLLSTEGRLSVYYAPFDAVNTAAKVAIIGITPGWQQMEIAFRVSRRELLRGATPEQASWSAKMEASFAGAMRRNLVSMLDQLGLARQLSIGSAEDLFAGASGLVHTTSAFRYPVFRGRQ